MHHDIFKHLELADAFKGLTIVTFTDNKEGQQPSPSTQTKERPFFYPSPSLSPTTSEEEEEISELIDNIDLLVPEEVTNNTILIEDSDWSPPTVAFQRYNHERCYSTLLQKEIVTNCVASANN